MTVRLPSWSTFDGWLAPPKYLETWTAAEAWATSYERVVEAAAAAFERVVEGWDVRLRDIGGDPGREDWGSFRPLRLSREEDWSDWLAHLLERSRSGRFAARLFARDVAHASRWRVSGAEREIAAEEYRADIVVRFGDDEWIHVEVKVGDLALEKTPDTGAALRRNVSGRCRGDYLLLPDDDVRHWAPFAASAAHVTTITWEGVAAALRRSIVEPEPETIAWRVWGRTFLGAVEQQLLGFRPIGPARVARRAFSARDLAHLRYLEFAEQDHE